MKRIVAWAGDSAACVNIYVFPCLKKDGPYDYAVYCDVCNFVDFEERAERVSELLGRFREKKTRSGGPSNGWKGSPLV